MIWQVLDLAAVVRIFMSAPSPPNSPLPTFLRCSRASHGAFSLLSALLRIRQATAARTFERTGTDVAAIPLADMDISAVISDVADLHAFTRTA
jgi:hypothetical protein